MSPKTRRRDHILPPENTELLFQKGGYGVLPTVGEEYLYGIPVSYVYGNGTVYIHCATVSSKLENVIKNPKAPSCVVGATQVLPGNFTTNYESMVLFRKAEEAFTEEEQWTMKLLVQKYSPEFMQKRFDYIKNTDSRVKVIKITVDHLTGRSRK